LKYFLPSCFVILTLTASAKLYSATGHAAILAVPDALLGASNHSILIAAGVLELAVAAFLLLSEDCINRCLCILWLALNFTLYRVGMFWLHPGKLCPCLGNVTDKLGLRPQTANRLLEAVIVYMLVGSALFLIRGWRRQATAKKTIMLS
jgi:hypothetical protein